MNIFCPTGPRVRLALALAGLFLVAGTPAATLTQTRGLLPAEGKTGLNLASSEQLQNYVWPLALELRLSRSGDFLRGIGVQALETDGEARWFKFRVQPGSRVVVTLTNLPANYDLALFKDIQQAFDAIVAAPDLPRLDAEFADDAFSRGELSSSAFAPESLAPDAFAPAQFSPAQFSPAQFSQARSPRRSSARRSSPPRSSARRSSPPPSFRPRSTAKPTRGRRCAASSRYRPSRAARRRAWSSRPGTATRTSTCWCGEGRAPSTRKRPSG